MEAGFFAVTREALTLEQRGALVQGIVGSEFFGESALGREFVDTQGFSLVFKREALSLVAHRFPYLRDLLETVLFDACNAFYINPLILHGDSRVDAHIDCRLVSPADLRIIPNLVSVFYAEISPEMIGGRLVLNPGTATEIAIEPCPGDVVHFVGSTIHLVESVRTPLRRVSVVCEQYHLDESVLEAFPLCEVITGVSGAARLNALDSEARPQEPLLLVD